MQSYYCSGSCSQDDRPGSKGHILPREHLIGWRDSQTDADMQGDMVGR